MKPAIATGFSFIYTIYYVRTYYDRTRQPHRGREFPLPMSPVKLASPYTQSIKEFWQTFVDKQVGRQPTHLLSGWKQHGCVSISIPQCFKSTFLKHLLLNTFFVRCNVFLLVFFVLFTEIVFIWVTIETSLTFNKWLQDGTDKTIQLHELL